MTRYLTADAFVGLFGEREVLAIAGAGGPNSAGGRQVDAPRVEQAIARAASLADGYVLGRFPRLAAMPTSDIPPVLAGAVADIARWYLRDDTGDAGVRDDVVRQRYEDAIRWLERVRDGRVDLASEMPASATAADGAVADGVRADMPASRMKPVLAGWR